MPSRLLLYCLGVPRLESEAGDEVRLGARKHLALLIYLALEPKVLHRRERLIDLFWPTVPQKAGRQSLATALNVLRSRLGRESIDADREHIRLVKGAVHLDVDRLVAGEILGDDLTPALDIGGFLVGFDPADTPEFGMWCDRQRAKLLPAIKAGLVTLMDCARRTAAIDQLGILADRLLTIDDLAEEGIRARMEVSALAGDRLTALRIYDEWSARLDRDLGATPSVLVEGMAVRLRRSSWEQPKVPIRVAETGRWQHQQFVGRAEEFRRLYDQWEIVRSGRSHHVLLTGESGVGKTTLADRFATGAGLEGATVARVRCFELERGIPYAAVGGLLRAVLDKPGASATSPLSLAELGRVIPAVHTYWPNLPAPVDAQGESARIRFAESALELLTVLMDEHPVILIIDDFHIADEASLSVVHLLIRRLQDHPFMVVMTSRRDLPESATSAAKIRDGASYLGVTIMEVPPMKVEEGEELLDILLAGAERRPSLPERRALLDAAGGLPMALSVLTADWEQRGAASLALSLGGMTLDVTGIPNHGFRRLTESLDQGLSTTARTVLHMAAILDSRLNEFELYGLIGLSVGQTLAGMTELVSRGAMRDPGGRLEFTSPMIRASSYVRVPVVLRRGIHTLVADRLLARESEGETIPGLELAWHCIRSGRSAEAGPHLLRGGREAINSGAPHEAELALRAGIQLLTQDTREEGQVLLAEVLQDLGGWKDSLMVLSTLQPGPEVRKAKVITLTVAGRHRLGYYPPRDQHGVVSQLIGIVGNPRLPVDLRMDSCRAAIAIAAKLNDARLFRLLLRECEELPISDLVGFERAKGLVTLALLHYQLRDRAAAETALIESEGILNKPSMSNSPMLATVRIGLGVIKCAEGNYSEAIPALSQALATGSKLDNTTLVVQSAANLSLCHLRLGEYENARRWGRLALSDIGESYFPEYQVQAAYCLAFSLACRGDKGPALDVVTRMNRAILHLELDWLQQAWALFRADVYFLISQKRRALQSAAEGLRQGRHELHAVRQAGIYARWATHLEASPDGEATARSSLQQLWKIGLHLDALDLVELLAASHRLGLSLTAYAPAANLARSTAERLPRPVSTHLRRLGFETPWVSMTNES